MSTQDRLNEIAKELLNKSMLDAHNAELESFALLLSNRGEIPSTSIVDAVVNNLPEKNYNQYTALTETIRNVLNFRVGESWGMDPKISRKAFSEYVDIEFGILRQMALANSSILTLAKYNINNPLKLPLGKISTEKVTVVTLPEDGNVWIGPTKVSLFSVYSPEYTTSKKEERTAAFSMSVKSITFSPIENEENFVELKIEFYNKLDKYSAFPHEDFNQYIPIEASDTSYDKETIQIGYYIDPDTPSMNNIVSDVLNGLIYDVGNGVHAAGAAATDSILATLQEGVLDTQLWCCIFNEVLKNSPELTASYVNWSDKIEEASLHLEEYKVYLLQVKQIAQAILGLLELKNGQIGWPALGFNLTEMATTSVALVLMTMLDVLQEFLMETVVEWVDEKKAELEANIDGNTSEVLTTVNTCLPWEKIIMTIVNSIFGKDGLFKSIQAFIQRIKNGINMRTKKNKVKMKMGIDLPGSPDSPDKVGEALDKYIIPTLRGLVYVLDALLAVNLRGLDICANQDMSGKFTEDNEPDGTEPDLTTGEDSDPTGDNDPDSRNIKRPVGPTRYSPGTPDGSKIDITNTDIDPIALLLNKDDAEVKKFMTQFMGLSASESADALNSAKTGECLKNMSSDSVKELQAILNQAGTNI